MGLVVDAATPKLLEITKALRDKAALHNIMARAGAAVIEKHFVKLAFSNKNRFGRPNTFWKRMRGSVRPESSIAQAAVVMDRAVALRLFGGIVKAKFKKFLTIPLTKDAYGKSARQFKRTGTGGTFIRNFGDGEFYISRFIGSGKNRQIENLYKLVKRTKHNPNQHVLPPQLYIESEVKQAVNKWLNRRTGL